MTFKLTGRLIIYTLAIILVAYTLLLLAAFQSARARTFSRVGALYRATFKTPEKTTVTRVEVHERKVVQLPPPPPPTSAAPVTAPKAPRVILKASAPKSAPATPTKEVDEVVTESSEETTRVLTPSGRRSETRATTSAPAPAPAPAVAKGAEQEAAFKNLLAGNQRMANLVNQSDPKLKFKGWSPIKSDGDEHWIEVVFQNTADNSEVKYIWSVNNASRRVAPINYNAKQLVAAK